MTRHRSRTSRRPLLALVATATLLLPACAADDVASGEESPTTSAASGSGGTVVVGGANFTEALVMQAMYVALLEEAGYATETVSVDAREIYFPELAAGNIGVVPEYAATLAEFLNAQANGEGAAPIASNDPAATLDAARPLAEAQGVELLTPAAAISANGFAVTQEFAEANDLTSLSDLAELGQPLVIAATEECPERPFCQGGLESEYGLQFSSSLPTGFSTPQTKAAVQSGEAQLGLVGTTDGTLGQFGLVVLEDDKKLQLADNLVPAVAADLAADQGLVDALESLSAVLTTEDLTGLNSQVDNERLLPADVATAYLQEQELVEG
jgi:osmoprotectant transport system substrate-binding protein